MTTDVVLKNNEVSIDGVRYRLRKPVEYFLASQYAPATQVGGHVDARDPRTAVVTWNDFTGGLGLAKTDGSAEQQKRQQWARANIRHPGHLFNGRGATTLSLPSTQGSLSTLNVIGESQQRGELWVGLTSKLFALTSPIGTTAAWTTPPLMTLGGPIRAIEPNVMLGANRYDVAGSSDGIGYFDWGTSAFSTNPNIDVHYLKYWNGLLYGINTSAELIVSTTALTTAAGAFTTLVKVPAPIGEITAFFVGRDAADEEVLYVATQVGLFIYDSTNTRFLQTGIRIPRTRLAGSGATWWNGHVYFPVGYGLFQYDVKNGLVVAVGPDREDGLTSGQGDITHLVPSLRELYIVTRDRASFPATLDNGVFAWDGKGWMNLVDGQRQFIDLRMSGILTTLDLALCALSSITTDHEFWYMSVPREQEQPGVFTTPGILDDAGIVYLPAFTGGDQSVTKTALEVVALHKAPTTGLTTIRLSYAIDGATSTALTGINATTTLDTVTRFLLPTSSNPVGVDFQSIRFGINLHGSSTISPDLLALQLRYRKKLPSRWGFRMELDLSGPYGGRTIKQLREALADAVESTTTVKLSYRPPGGTTDTYFVDLTVVGNEKTGVVYEGAVQVEAQEV